MQAVRGSDYLFKPTDWQCANAVPSIGNVVHDAAFVSGLGKAKWKCAKGTFPGLSLLVLTCRMCTSEATDLASQGDNVRWATKYAGPRNCHRELLGKDPQEALQLLTSWDQQRIRDAAQYEDVVDGHTPLHWACRSSHVKVVEMLLKYGVDTEAKNDTTASVVVAVDKWLKLILPERTTTHTLPHLDAFISGAAKQNPNLATMVASIRKTIDEARPDFPAMDWAAFQTAITQALNALDQALEAPEALSNRLEHLDPNTDNLETVLQELHDVTAGLELQPAFLELQTVLAACPAPSTTPVIAPKTPPTDLAAALSKVIALSGVEPKRQELLTSTNSNLKSLVLALIDALGAVARAGTTDTDTILRVETLRQCAQCVDASAPPPAEALPEAWEKLCQAHEKLSLLEQNCLEQIAQWQPPLDFEHQDWYLAFVHHESQALLQQLQDIIDWQATTLSVLTSCMSHVDSLTQDVDDESVAAHEELTKLQAEIQGFHTALQHLPEDVHSSLEHKLREKKERLDALRHQLSDQPHVDHVAELAQLLHQHLPALLVFLHPEQSTLGTRLHTVLGPDLPASLILEAMTEVDQGLTLSSLGQLSLQYNQNHKVYKARAALPNLPEQDLAVKEYAFARQHKQDQCRTFLRELRAMRQLVHPHIIPVLGALVDVHSGHPSAYLVQPWCTQGDLQQWLGKARHIATSTVVAGLMTQLRTALAFMHSKGLVHRDIKLSNVMLDGEEDQPVVRLGDFDIAKASAEATMLPCTATASSGTAGYVAPEVLFGMGRVGARPAQDAFSFGCVLYNTYMFPQTVPPAHPRVDEVVDRCSWSIRAGESDCDFPHLATEMCDSSSDLYKETRALLATDPKQRPSLFSARNITQQPALAQVGPAIDVLRDAPELMSEVGELLKQLNIDGRGPANIAVQRVERVHNPVLWERYSAKRREMLHRIKNQVHYDQLQTATSDAPSGSPALLCDTSCQERLLLHGIAPDTMLRDKIVRLGLDYRFAGSSAGHRFGLGVYLADHPGKEISTLIFMYLLLCKPLKHMLSSWLQKRGSLKTPDDENGIHNAEQDDEDFLDDELDEDHMSHDETMTLRREAMVSPATIYAAFRRQMITYLHRPTLGVATWRHAATFWMTTFVINRLSAETTGALGSLIHTQAQHSGDTAQRAYARTASDHVQTKMSSRLMHQVASQKWHALFGLDRKRSIAELTANQEALEARYPISWNPVTDLSPEANGRIIMNTRAEHDVPYMTQLAKQASISWGHSFNSQEQLDLAAAIDQHRPEDGWLIVVAPTGMGKTFCTLPKLGCRPHAGTVLWIVPFVAVANDLLRRFQGAGHSAQRWLGPSTQVADGLDVLIVTTDMFVRVGSESLHGKVCFQHIRTVVMDEAHTLISDASYRDVMDEVAASVGSGGWTNIKRVALTGTLCIGDQEHLFRKLGQQVGGKVYRLETMRRDLQLRVLHGNQPNFLSHVQAIVDTRVMRQANGERVHMMVFCDTVNEVKLLCDQLHAYGYMALPYYTDLEEKAFGRAGRDKQGGTAELWLPVRRGPAPGMEKFVEGNACRSWALGKLLDPRAATCFAAGQPLCDVCAGTAQRLEPAIAARQQRAAQALSVGHVEAEPEAMAEEEDVLSEPPAARLEEEESIGPESALDVTSASNVDTVASPGPGAVAAQSSRSTPRAQDTAAVATNAGPMTDAAVPRIQTSDAWIGEADTASMSVPASPMVSDANDEAPLQQEARGPVQTTMAEDESTPQPVMQSAAQPTPTKHAPTPSASIICVPVPSASGSTSSPTRSAASSASGTLRRKRVPLAAESTCTPGSDDHNNVGNSIATSPAPSTSKRTASDVTCTGAASLTAAQAAESRLPAAKRAASSDARTATVAATATTRSEATVSAAATPPNRHNVAPIFRSKSGTKKKYLMNYAAADKFIGVLKLMDDYCMRCTIRQAKPVLKAGHQCVSNRVCERCHFKGHEASKCFVGFAYPDRACCYACGMPKGIRGCKTWDHLCRQSQGLDSGLSCLLLYSDCHSGLRDLSQRMGYNLRERTLKDIKTRDLFVKWLYSSGPCPFPGDGHWRLVEFVFE
ncbi:uncharacterized protein MONBRDRAFT_36063, partial [Monosiga brevicollis MX1]